MRGYEITGAQQRPLPLLLLLDPCVIQRYFSPHEERAFVDTRDWTSRLALLWNYLHI